MIERLHQRDKEKWKSICERNGKVKDERERERERERDVQSRLDD